MVDPSLIGGDGWIREVVFALFVVSVEFLGRVTL